MSNHLYAIDSGYFYAGILVNDGVIVTTAPVLRWSVGWGFHSFVQYVNRKKWAIIDVEVGK